MLRFRLLGNWKAANQFLDDLPNTVLKASLDSQKDIADKLKKIVKGHIVNNDIDLEPLAITTIKRKSSEIPLLDNGDYLRAIKVWKEGNVYYCGVKKSDRNSKGESIYMLANILEYGAETLKGSIPERPLWKISLKEIGGREGIRNKTEKLIKNRLRIINSRFIFEIN